MCVCMLIRILSVLYRVPLTLFDIVQCSVRVGVLSAGAHTAMDGIASNNMVSTVAMCTHMVHISCGGNTPTCCMSVVV